MEKPRFSSTIRSWFTTPLKVALPVSFITALLATFFMLGLVFTDYWNIPQGALVKGMMLAATLALGASWSSLAAGRRQVTIRVADVLVFVTLLGLMVLLNLRPLNAVLPWRGDEDHHFRVTLSLLRKMGSVPFSLILIIFCAWLMLLYISWRRPKWVLLPAGLLTAVILLAYPSKSLFGVLRYPFINDWFYALAMYPASQFGDPYQEYLFRLVPFLSAFLLAFTLPRYLAGENIAARLLWGMAVAVIPSVFYYSSVLYLEMPAVLLMTVVCLRAGELLKQNFSDIRGNPGWYALILIGFIKETTLPFLVVFVGWRALVTFHGWLQEKRQVKATGERPRSFLHGYLLGELAVYFVTLLPLGYYLVFRSVFAHTRSYKFSPSNLLDPQVYLVMARSFLDQFGVFAVLFILGCVLLLKRRRVSALIFQLLVILGYALFFMLEHKEYIGYSRFNLFFLPPILAGSAVFIKELAHKWKHWGYALAVTALVTSLLITPILVDGTKKPGWGNYLFDTSEHYYPVEDALVYLKDNASKESVLFAGMYYEYTFFFYTRKIHWRPERSDMLLSNEYVHDDNANLADALTRAETEGYDKVVFFVLGEEVPLPPDDSTFQLAEVISNLAHEIAIYSRE